MNETGLSYQDVHHATQLFKSYGMKVGIFIGSMYSSNDLNSVGHGIVTIEEHRYLPSHVQAMDRLPVRIMIMSFLVTVILV